MNQPKTKKYIYPDISSLSKEDKLASIERWIRSVWYKVGEKGNGLPMSVEDLVAIYLFVESDGSKNIFTSQDITGFLSNNGWKPIVDAYNKPIPKLTVAFGILHHTLGNFKKIDDNSCSLTEKGKRYYGLISREVDTAAPAKQWQTPQAYDAMVKSLRTYLLDIVASDENEIFQTHAKELSAIWIKLIEKSNSKTPNIFELSREELTSMLDNDRIGILAKQGYVEKTSDDNVFILTDKARDFVDSLIKALNATNQWVGFGKRRLTEEFPEGRPTNTIPVR